MSIVALTNDPILGWGWHNRDYQLTNTLFAPVSPGETNIGNAAFPVLHFQDDAVVGGILNSVHQAGFCTAVLPGSRRPPGGHWPLLRGFGLPPVHQRSRTRQHRAVRLRSAGPGRRGISSPTSPDALTVEAACSVLNDNAFPTKQSHKPRETIPGLAGLFSFAGLRQDFSHHVAVHVGEPVVAAGVAVG